MITINAEQRKSLVKLLDHLEIGRSDIQLGERSGVPSGELTVGVGDATYTIWVNGEIELKLKERM